MEKEHNNASNFAESSFILQVISLALPNFYKKTGLKANINISLDEDNESISFLIGFLPRKPNEEEALLLYECILDAEKVCMNSFTLDKAYLHDHLKQLIFECKESVLDFAQKYEAKTH